ncbi:hypothetical protein BCR32DRAFT_165923 [Anaeromyces robustus]|uniref:Uncharacterized protein n=1 Tax=Anaeromyces robustus TaxID=1754192 RepID=A0A1Y1U999_9FUNG|nr:hypothetical protein BCR32DRAFT_165923 [Anaeromyces robustus]|eukprot:ORX34609.1 hypothetical protein BCR32DRAFT_165923 [Anaeromyces robustus]
MEVSNKLNRLFTSPLNSKYYSTKSHLINSKHFISGISPSKNSFLLSRKDYITPNGIEMNSINKRIINNQDDDNDDLNNSNEKEEFTEIKSNFNVMEKIFMNEDHENIETKEKNYNDFNILKNMINNKKNNNKIIEENVSIINNKSNEIPKENNKIDGNAQSTNENNINNKDKVDIIINNELSKDQKENANNQKIININDINNDKNSQNQNNIENNKISNNGTDENEKINEIRMKLMKMII